MKKFIPFLFVGIVVVLVSCKKEHTCSCNYQTFTGTVTQTVKITETKSEAEKICQTYETPIAGTFWKCEILD